MYNYYSNAGFVENAAATAKRYAPILFIGGTALLVFDIFGPSIFSKIGGGPLLPLISLGLMAIGGFYIFFNASSPLTVAGTPPPQQTKIVRVPEFHPSHQLAHQHAVAAKKAAKAKYAYYY